MRKVLRSPSVPSIDGYQLLEKIGEGGMGSVYKARPRDGGEPVAVKLLSPEKHGGATVLKRFEQEFHAASRLDHPNIVKVRDFGRASFPFHRTLFERIRARDPQGARAEVAKLVATVEADLRRGARMLDGAHGR